MFEHARHFFRIKQSMITDHLFVPEPLKFSPAQPSARAAAPVPSTPQNHPCRSQLRRRPRCCERWQNTDHVLDVALHLPIGRRSWEARHSAGAIVSCQTHIPEQPPPPLRNRWPRFCFAAPFSECLLKLWGERAAINSQRCGLGDEVDHEEKRIMSRSFPHRPRTSYGPTISGRAVERRPASMVVLKHNVTIF